MCTAIQSKAPGPQLVEIQRYNVQTVFRTKIIKRTTGEAGLLPPLQPRRYLLSSLHQLASTSAIPIVRKGRQVEIYQYSGYMEVTVLW
jgi:hypothetical protein